MTWCPREASSAQRPKSPLRHLRCHSSADRPTWPAATTFSSAARPKRSKISTVRSEDCAKPSSKLSVTTCMTWLLGRAWVDRDAGELDRSLDPFTARAAAGALHQLDRAAVHAQRRVGPERTLAGVALDVVPDEGPAKAVASVRLAPVDERAVEEEDVARLHHHRYELLSLGQRHGDVGEALGRVRVDRAEDGPVLAPREHLETAVLLVARLERHPRRDARPRLYAQVVLVLVHRLASRSRRLEVQHRLHGERLEPAQQRRQRVRKPRLEQPIERDPVPPVHVDHARIALQRVVRGRIDADDVSGIAPCLAESSEVVAPERRLLAAEEAARDEVAPLVEQLLVDQHEVVSSSRLRASAER